MLPNALPHSPKAVCHDRGGSKEIYSWSETPSGQAALVLDGAVAARGRHVLRHGDGVRYDVNGWVGW